jgi:hypothetical protein
VVLTSPATTVTALDPASLASSPIPKLGNLPTAFFINNPARPDTNATLGGVLSVLDAGKVKGGVFRCRTGSSRRGLAARL